MCEMIDSVENVAERANNKFALEVKNNVSVVESTKKDGKEFVRHVCEIENNSEVFTEDLETTLQTYKDSCAEYTEIRDKRLQEVLFINQVLEEMKKQRSKLKQGLLVWEGSVKEENKILEELNKEKQESLNMIKNQHNAYKQATKYYKMNLNFHLSCKMENDLQQFLVCFFTQKWNDTYSLVLCKSFQDLDWKIKEIKPEIDKAQFDALQKRFKECNCVTTLVCTVRKILIIYYKESKK